MQTYADYAKYIKRIDSWNCGRAANIKFDEFLAWYAEELQTVLEELSSLPDK